ncbi:MAG TPA: deoxyguanosinetriphosphate triphosphohydrolase, partial [Acidimicrobiales bacterium]|nr:deoxyguanosinetriphosphate triphosphohydrolase [Acidimicrobiales bacterium]
MPERSPLPCPPTAPEPGAGARTWASTMRAHPSPDGVATAHATAAEVAVGGPLDRVEREALEAAGLAPGATRAAGAGRRLVDEPPDPWRTCFERDRDRILHASA